jgi:chemotaxis protein methyltransferase CheR
MIPPITEKESTLLREYVERVCGIRLDKAKEYLLETRLSHLVAEYEFASFGELHHNAVNSPDVQLRDRIIDAMTTNETSWFRDESAWRFLREHAAPALLDQIQRNEHPRVWSSAASTGQEAYSFVILLLEIAEQRGMRIKPDQIRVLGTDISQSALFQAIAGRYDVFAMARGMPNDLQSKYFTVSGRMWEIADDIKAFVTFRKFNLQDPFTGIGGPFDLVLSRNVAIYFSEKFRRELFEKTTTVMKEDAVLLLGATESLRGYTESYEIREHKGCAYNMLRT